MDRSFHALLVADDKERVEPVTELERAGLTVTLARDDSAAVELLRRSASSFDVFISYALKSAAESKDLVARIRSLRADLPILVVLEVKARIEPWDEHVHWFHRPRGSKAVADAATKWIRPSNVYSTPVPSRAAESFLFRETSSRYGATPHTVTATEAKNQLPELLEQAAQRGPVIITKHQKPKGVLLGIDEYRALTGTGARRLATLTEEFDVLLARMQEPEMPARLKAAFASTPEAIGKAAVKAEKKKR